MKISGIILVWSAALLQLGSPAPGAAQVRMTAEVQLTVDPTLPKLPSPPAGTVLAIQLLRHGSMISVNVTSCPQCAPHPDSCRCFSGVQRLLGTKSASYSARAVWADSTFAATNGAGGQFTPITYYSSKGSGAGKPWAPVSAHRATWVFAGPKNPHLQFVLRIPPWTTASH